MDDRRDQEIARARAEYEMRDGDPLYASMWSSDDPIVARTLESQERATRRALAFIGAPLGTLRILDVGCGSGSLLERLISWGADPALLAGVDLAEGRMAAAAARLPDQVTLAAGSADRMPFDSGSFDVVTQFTVFSSVLDPGLRTGIAAEIGRVLRPGGHVLWYDMRRDGLESARKWRQVRDESSTHWFTATEVRALFPGMRASIGPVTLAPWVARRIAGLGGWAYALAECMPPLRSHHFAVIAKEGDQA